MKNTHEINQAGETLKNAADRAKARVERGYADFSDHEKKGFMRDVARYRSWGEICFHQRNWEGLQAAIDRLNRY